MNNPGQASLTGLPIVYYHAISNRPHAASHAPPGCARDERHEKVPILMHLHESSFAASTPRLPRGLTAAALSVLALSISVVAQALQVTGLQMPRSFLADVAHDGHGLLYASDPHADTIYRIDTTREHSVSVLVRNAALAGPRGLALHPKTGRLIVVSWNKGKILEVSGDGVITELVSNS